MFRNNSLSVGSTDSHQSLVAKKPEDFKLVGFDSELDVWQRTCFKTPEASMQNILCAATFANGIAGDVFEEISPLNNSTNLGVLGATWVITGINQAREFYEYHKKIHELQLRLIRALPTKKIIATEPDCKKTAKNLVDVEDIIQVMIKNGNIKIHMDKNIDITLQHNGFWSLRLFGGAAASVGASMTSAAIYISNRWHANLDPNNLNANLTLSATDQAALIAASVPMASAYNLLLNMLYKQEANIFDITRTIIKKLYMEENLIDKIPADILAIAEIFLDEEKNAINKKVLEKYKEFQIAKTIENLENGLETSLHKIAELEKITNQQVVVAVATTPPSIIKSKASTDSIASSITLENKTKPRCVIS